MSTNGSLPLTERLRAAGLTRHRALKDTSRASSRDPGRPPSKSQTSRKKVGTGRGGATVASLTGTRFAVESTGGNGCQARSSMAGSEEALMGGVGTVISGNT